MLRFKIQMIKMMQFLVNFSITVSMSRHYRQNSIHQFTETFLFFHLFYANQKKNIWCLTVYLENYYILMAIFEQIYVKKVKNTARISFVGTEISQRAHVKMTSYQRRCDVMTSHRRRSDIILTSCARWDGHTICLAE